MKAKSLEEYREIISKKYYGLCRDDDEGIFGHHENIEDILCDTEVIMEEWREEFEDNKLEDEKNDIFHCEVWSFIYHPFSFFQKYCGVEKINEYLHEYDVEENYDLGIKDEKAFEKEADEKIIELCIKHGVFPNTFNIISHVGTVSYENGEYNFAKKTY